MKKLLALQILVLAGLLFAGALCLSYTKQERLAATSSTESTTRYLNKLETDFPGEKHAAFVASVKSITTSEAAAFEALLADYEFIRALGNAMILLALVQGGGLYFLWRLYGKNA